MYMFNVNVPHTQPEICWEIQIENRDLTWLTFCQQPIAVVRSINISSNYHPPPLTGVSKMPCDHWERWRLQSHGLSEPELQSWVLLGLPGSMGTPWLSLVRIMAFHVNDDGVSYNSMLEYSPSRSFFNCSIFTSIKELNLFKYVEIFIK